MSDTPPDPRLEAVRDVLAGWPIGSGYYQTSVDVSEAAEMAEAVLAELAITTEQVGEAATRLTDFVPSLSLHEARSIAAHQLRAAGVSIRH